MTLSPTAVETISLSDLHNQTGALLSRATGSGTMLAVRDRHGTVIAVVVVGPQARELAAAGEVA